METPQEIIPSEILDLLRFMCETWVEIDRFVYKNCDADALMEYPVIQGTGNRIQLQRIGEQPYDSANIKKAVEWMLAHGIKQPNPQALRPTLA